MYFSMFFLFKFTFSFTVLTMLIFTNIAPSSFYIVLYRPYTFVSYHMLYLPKTWFGHYTPIKLNNIKCTNRMKVALSSRK